MASSPIYLANQKTWSAPLSTANTNRDGTGTIATIATAGSSGSRIDRVRIVAAGTVTAGAVRLFLNDGTNTRLFREVMVEATTPSASVETFTKDIDYPDGLGLPVGWSLRAATNNAEAFNVFAHGGDF